MTKITTTLVSKKQVNVEFTPKASFTSNVLLRGLKGEKGDKGDDAFYMHVQSIPEGAWEIEHNMNKFPSVTVVDSSNTIVIGDVEYVSDKKIILKFSGAFSGKAYLN